MERIGFTYDARSEYIKIGLRDEEIAEFDRDDTISLIEESLCNLGYVVDRIGNIHNLLYRFNNKESWNLVFNICEGLYGSSRESQVPGVLDVYRIPYVFSDSLTLAITLDKSTTKKILKYEGIPTSDFRIVRNEEDIDLVKLKFPLFLKPVREGSGKGIDRTSKVDDLYSLKKKCIELLKVYNQPVLVENYLSGCEYTVGIVGTGKNSKVIGVLKVIFKDKEDVYSYFVKENYSKFVKYELANRKVSDWCADIALKTWRIFGCRDGGRIDIRLDNEGTPNVMDVNALAELNRNSDYCILSEMSGISYDKLIELIVNSSKERLV